MKSKKTPKDITVVFTDIKPTDPGVYFYRPDKRKKRATSWNIVEISRKRNKTLVAVLATGAVAVNEVKGQFSTVRLAA